MKALEECLVFCDIPVRFLNNPCFLNGSFQEFGPINNVGVEDDLSISDSHG